MKHVKDENGYVLVVIMGILTIMALMAITFATLSRIETRATRNYTDSVKCELIARAGLEHAIYVLRMDKFGTDTIAYNDDNGDENYDWSGETWMPGGGDFSGNDYDNDGDSAPDSKWIYFPATSSASDIKLPGKLRARYAILITDEREARININVTGNKAGSGNGHTLSEGWSTFEIDLSSTIAQASGLNSTDGDNIASDIINTRAGSDLNPGTSAINDNSGIIPDHLTDGIDNDGDWDLSTDDVNNNGIPDSGESNVNEADEATDEPNEFNTLNPNGDDRPFSYLTEAEIIEGSAYTSRLETIYNTRGVSQSDQDSLNGWLTTYSADNIITEPYQLDGGTSTTMLNINALSNNMGAYTNTEYYDSDKKVVMIMDILLAGGVTGTSGSTGYVERHQLAVNIKDFIDSDSVVTIYSDGANTYYGVEKTPYINEVEAEVDEDVAGGFGKFIELFNPYDTDIDITNWKIEFGTNAVNIAGTIGSRTYYVIADNAQAYETDFAYEGGTAADQYEPDLNTLIPSGETLTLRDSSGNVVQVTDYGTGDVPESMQLNDPRPTPLARADGSFPDIDTANPWRWQKKDVTAGSQNKDYDPGQGIDGWTTGTWQPGFVASDRCFSNRGYLGFIHRGRQWSSFRVSKDIDYPNVLQYITVTDPSMDGIDNDGDGSVDYDDTGSPPGDIDGPEYRIPGLINVNTAPKEVLMSLPGITSTIADNIISKRSIPFDSLGDFADRADKVTNDIGATKWEKEKIFRSISNLITTRSNVFSGYVTAQLMDESLSEIYAEKRIVAIVDRSVDPIKVRYFRWVTE